MSEKGPSTARGKHLTLSLYPSTRTGKWRIIINRKTVSLATRRNRWKRRIREALRQYAQHPPQGYRGAFKVYWAAGEPSFAALRKEIQELLQQAGQSIT